MNSKLLEKIINGGSPMNYKDLLTLIIIFLMVLTLGLRTAEQGVYSTMGIETRPQIFDLDYHSDGVYNLNIMGKNFELDKKYKIGDLNIIDRLITLKINEKEIKFSPIISLHFLKEISLER